MLTPSERNALAWVQFIEYYDRIKDDPNWHVFVRTRIALQRNALENAR